MFCICHTFNGFKLFLFYVLGSTCVFFLKATLKNMEE